MNLGATGPGIRPACKLPMPVYVDYRTPRYVRAGTLMAIKVWNAVTERQVFEWRGIAMPYQNHGILVRMIPEDRTKDLAWWRLRDGPLCTRFGRVDVIRGRKHCPERTARIMMHELGHAIGLRHEDAKNRDSVMDHITDTCTQIMNDHFCSGTLKRFKELYRCTR